MDPTPTRRVPRRRREQEVSMMPQPFRSNGRVMNNNGHHHPTNNHFGHDRYPTAQLHQQHSDSNSLRRRGNLSLKVNQHTYNDNGSSEIYAASRIHNSARRSVYSRLARIIMLCVVMFYGVEIGLGIARSAINLVFGQRKEHKQQQLEFDTPIDNLHFTLRGSTENDISADGGMSRHDLNAKSNLLKADKDPILDREQMVDEEDPIEDTDNEGDQIEDTDNEEEKASEGYEVYMGEDSTIDYFFAGNIKSTKNVVDKSGRVKTVTIPAQKYATLPFSVGFNPFALSMWFYLSPLSEMMDKDGAMQDSRTTR
eukprot:scaffold7998_cov90-Skeletonema_marinoi.AAC.1